MTHDPSARNLAPATRLFDLAAEVEALRNEPRARDGGVHAKTLTREGDLRIVLLAMRAGARLHEHKTDHGVTVHALSGHVRVNVGSDAFDLPAGTMLQLARGLVHDVLAHDDSVLLLSIGWAGAS